MFLESHQTTYYSHHIDVQLSHYKHVSPRQSTYVIGNLSYVTEIFANLAQWLIFIAISTMWDNMLVVRQEPELGTAILIYVTIKEKPNTRNNWPIIMT